MWIFCQVEIPDWLFYSMSVWIFFASLIECMYKQALYIFYTYMSYTSLLANVVCFKYDFE